MLGACTLIPRKSRLCQRSFDLMPHSPSSGLSRGEFMPITTEDTSFTHDILRSYVCNTFAEAKQSGTFDVVIIGGGSYRRRLSLCLLHRDRTSWAAATLNQKCIPLLRGR